MKPDRRSVIFFPLQTRLFAQFLSRGEPFVKDFGKPRDVLLRDGDTASGPVDPFRKHPIVREDHRTATHLHCFKKPNAAGSDSPGRQRESAGGKGLSVVRPEILAPLFGSEPLRFLRERGCVFDQKSICRQLFHGHAYGVMLHRSHKTCQVLRVFRERMETKKGIWIDTQVVAGAGASWVVAILLQRSKQAGKEGWRVIHGRENKALLAILLDKP